MEPVYVDIVLYAVYALVVAACGLTLWSVVRGILLQGKDAGMENGVPARRIIASVAAFLVVTLAVTWLTASTKPLLINEKEYTDTFWLRTSEMLINTVIVLVVAIVILLVGEKVFRLVAGGDARSPQKH